MWYTKFSAMHSLPPKRILLWYTSKCNCIYACQKSTAFPAPILANTYGVISLNKIVIRNALTTSNLAEIKGCSLNRTGCVGLTSYFSVPQILRHTWPDNIISNNTARWHKFIITFISFLRCFFRREWKIFFSGVREN